jgi:hypothetical protein
MCDLLKRSFGDYPIEVRIHLEIVIYLKYQRAEMRLTKRTSTSAWR